jgi:hypothetical protein
MASTGELDRLVACRGAGWSSLNPANERIDNYDVVAEAEKWANADVLAVVLA